MIHNSTPPKHKVVMSDVDKFINIFEGSYSAYGQTRKTEEFDERGKHKTKSFIIKTEDLTNKCLQIIC